MTLFHFLSYNLHYGDKVILLLKDYNNETIETTAYFAGFRTLFNKHIAEAESLYPVFKKETKKGLMSNRTTDKYTSLDTLISVRKLDNVPNSFTLEQITELDKTRAIMANNCRQVTIGILKDVDSLFPGKWICLANTPINAAIWEEHGGIATGINARPIKIKYSKEGDEDGYIIDVDCDTYGTTCSSFRNELECNEQDILQSLTTAITEPEDVSELPDSECVIDFLRMGHKNVPKNDGKHQPLLSKMQLLDTLRYRLWWNSLTKKKKQMLFKPLIKNNSKKILAWLSKHPGSTFADYADMEWETSGLSLRGFLYENTVQKKKR